MSRKVRTSFAAPLVLTLAVAPACVVRTGSAPPPTTGGPSGGTTTTTTPPGPIVATNPPPVAAPPTQPDPGTAPRMPQEQQTVQQGPTPVKPLTTWTVYQNKTSGQCFAAIDVVCNPKATCNPPPPRALDACPVGMTADKPLKIEERAAGSCTLVFPVPTSCASNPACDPPRSRTVDCPS
ncbi:MAG: hypothetical protein R3B06_23190 [Kofleriaceae bacterium]